MPTPGWLRASPGGASLSRVTGACTLAPHAGLFVARARRLRRPRGGSEVIPAVLRLAGLQEPVFHFNEFAQGGFRAAFFRLVVVLPAHQRRH